ncbi:hypothetical protein MDA_GLEAN10009615 [Myotis davidii]|uniref:Uncharacterized protein n=1 Tax=Myotis davidii TaxID=225400 RepID=L5M7U8_MYODS|nr:hypothetical protein MDA_GLEAN10009615 [Myotis davidii]
MSVNMDELKHQVMINQFVLVNRKRRVQGLGAQCMNSCTLEGAVGHEAAVGTGMDLGPSSMPLIGPSCCSSKSPVCWQPCSCLCC